MIKYYLATFFMIFAPQLVADSPIELKIKESVMIENITSPTESWSLELPEFEIYNSDGWQIFKTKSFSSDFKEVLGKSLSNKPISKARISDVLKTLSKINNENVSTDILSDYDYIFVEYWAEWCAPCLQQMKIVEEYIQENKNIKIVWLKVEKDPAKLQRIKVEHKKI